MSVTTQKAFRAADFVELIGVGTHLTSTKSSYGDLRNVQGALAYLGVDNVRDNVPGPSPGNAIVQAYNSIGSFQLNGQTYTTHFDLIAGTSLPVTLTYLDAMAPYLDYVEGPNEVNIVPLTFTTSAGVKLTGKAAAVAYQQDLYAAVHGDPTLGGVSVMTFSLGLGTSYAGYGNVSAYTDYTNAHVYGQYGIPPTWFLQNEINAVTDSPGRPPIVTETGNYTMPNGDSGVNETVQAKLLMDTLLDDFSNGVKLTYIYQLLDPFPDPNNTTPEDHYGLFHYDGTPKVAATAIHDLTTILADSSATSQSFTPAPLSYAVTGMPSGAFQFALEKADGTYDVALWWEPWIWDRTTNSEVTFASNNVTLTLGQSYQTIKVYDPLVGTGSIATYHNVSAVNVALNTGPLIIEIDPNTSGQYIETGTAGGVFASGGIDTVVAGSGSATVNASGAATVFGSTGSLTVNLGGSRASVTGGSGALTVTESNGGNTVGGGAGAFSYTDLASGSDTITTGTSTSNKVTLGGGNDTVLVLGATTLVGGAGTANVTLTGAGSSVTGGAGALVITDKGGNNTVIGGAGAFSYTDMASGNDRITTGTSANNKVTLGGGSDTVTVRGATTLAGGAGAASVTLTGAGSSITGGTGTLSVTDSVGGNTISGGSGVLTVSASAGNDVITTANISGTSSVVLGTGADTVVAGGATSVVGNKASLTVSGNGPLSINGGTGSISLTGGTGNEYVFTQANTANTLTLGTGKNTVLSHGADTITATGGSDSVYAAAAASIIGGSGALSVNGGGGAVTVWGGSGAVRGSVGSNGYLQGGSRGGNVLGTSGTNVTLAGGGAGDTLTDTGSGSNLLVAGPGNTTLTAGAGGDTMVGGSGADLFVLTKAAAAHSEVIQGYKPGTDALSFSGFGSAAPIASQTVVGGNLQLVLADNAQITLVGVTSLS